MEALVNEGILDTPKEGYVKSKASKGKNAGTWMHPYLFIKFAMWLSPKFEVKVINFVYDKLIEFRNESGENYKEYASAINKWHYRKFGIPADKEVFSVFFVFENQ